MKTKKQEELVNTFLTDNMNEQTHLYREIAVYLSEFGNLLVVFVVVENNARPLLLWVITNFGKVYCDFTV
jgi:hypothetical protein